MMSGSLCAPVVVQTEEYCPTGMSYPGLVECYSRQSASSQP